YKLFLLSLHDALPISKDGGHSFDDLGIILTSGDSPNCNAGNGYFAGGHGDFTVVVDPWRFYFYFYFTNYGGSSQGIAGARLPFSDRKSTRLNSSHEWI